MQAQARRLPAAVNPESAPPLDDRDEVKLIGVTKTFPREAEIFAEGDAPDFIFRVISGAVRSCRLLSDGRRQIIDFFLPGDVFGVELGCEHQAGADALTDAQVVIARRSSVIAAEPEQAARLWKHALGELRRSQNHVLTLGRRAACERVANFLVDLADRLGGHDAFDLPMSRQDIADYLGLTIETVSRTLTQLQGERLIELKSCRRIRFLDRAALEDLCE